MCAQRKLETDVLVVGSGAVGVAAVIEAREAGASVIILEKEDILGGAAAISGGGCALVDTALQREAGIEDSGDQAFEDWIRQGQGSADEVWARFYIERSNDALFEWAKDRGVEWVAARRNEGNTVARWHLPNGGGRGLWNALYKTARGVRFHSEDLSGGGSGSVAVMAQNPAYCWSVLDSTMTDGITVSDPQYNLPGSSVNDPDKIEALLHESPSIKSGETLEALASEIGLPVDIFIETVNRYNSAIDQGLEREPDFGRSLSGKKMIERPPFYGLNFTPLARKTFGGVRPTSTARRLTSITIRFAGCTPQGSWQAWPGATSTARPAWKARCSAQRCSVDVWPEHGPPATPDSVTGSSSSYFRRKPGRRRHRGLDNRRPLA